LHFLTFMCCRWCLGCLAGCDELDVGAFIVSRPVDSAPRISECAGCAHAGHQETSHHCFPVIFGLFTGIWGAKGAISGTFP
jgi:hypothetical protein